MLPSQCSRLYYPLTLFSEAVRKKKIIVRIILGCHRTLWFVPRIVQLKIVNLSFFIHMLPSLYSRPHAPIPILLSPYYQSEAPIPTSHPHTSIIILGMLLYFSCGVVMLLGWEHGDGIVRISTPLHDPVPNAPVHMLALLCSHYDTLPTIPSPYAPFVV
jgi:hypothetical protein